MPIAQWRTFEQDAIFTRILPMILSADHFAHLTDVLKWRRDVRHFSTAPIDPADLGRLEASVDLAPSVGNSRPWRIVRVLDQRRRNAVAQCFEDCNRTASRIYDDEARNAYLALKLAGLREAPVHLAVFTDPAPAEGRGLGSRTMPETYAYSTVMAVHTLWLAARALNIGVGWVSILDPAAVRRILEVPELWRLTAYLCIGYPLENADCPELHRRDWQCNTPTVWLDR